MSRFYRVCRAVAWVALRVLYRVRVEGAVNIPIEGPVILCGNHISYIDPVLVACASPRQVRFMAKKELYKSRILRWFLSRIGAFPVDRGAADITAMRTAFGILKEGGALGIFPEGTRVRGVKTEANTGMESGVAMIVARAPTPVVPMRVMGRYRLFRRQTLVIGAPLDLTAILADRSSERIAEATAALQSSIRGLIPESTET